MVVAAIAISLATLLVKQHLLADVFAGVALAFGAHALAKRLYECVVDPESEPRQALAQVFDGRRWVGRAARTR